VDCPAAKDRRHYVNDVILSSATMIEEARWLAAHEVDAIIAQGLEAGGHPGPFLSQDLSQQIGAFARRAGKNAEIGSCPFLSS
jgi:NAD(P)H-dependent flavin oxidoreductase YrpB (nitropropane dioxygenase family)